VLIKCNICVEKKDKNGGAYSTHGLKRNMLEVTVGKPEELRSLGSN
jgi:hypothetical protein